MKCQSTFKRVCFVATAGRAKRCYWKDRKLPFFIAWSPFRIFYRLFGIVVVFLHLKEETIARFRLAAEIIRWSVAERLFVSGRYDDDHLAENVTERYFLESGLLKDQVSAKAFSRDNFGNIEQFLDILAQEYPEEKCIDVYVVDASYRMARTTRDLGESAKTKGLEIFIIEAKVLPKLTWKSFKEDLLFNIITERMRRNRSYLRNFCRRNWDKVRKEYL